MRNVPHLSDDWPFLTHLHHPSRKSVRLKIISGSF
uniref:Uncharacterized protein n=1 Tax=Anguilla anguilla TaxID=7936 RepID=A0A0E9TDM7_ANGAN